MLKKNIPDTLLADVKNYLNITWNDDNEDDKVKEYIASGSMYLDNKGGEVLDYLSDGLPRTLLFEYARYMRDSALEVFENNYRSLIMAMQSERAVARYVQNTEKA